MEYPLGQPLRVAIVEHRAHGGVSQLDVSVGGVLAVGGAVGGVLAVGGAVCLPSYPDSPKHSTGAIVFEHVVKLISTGGQDPYIAL
jgi:hypothetical protein